MISLGIDIGGTGAKCVAFQEDGTQIAVGYREYPNESGKTDLNANVLTDCVKEVIHDCVARLPDAKEVAAITVSSFGESFVPIDANGEPLTDIIMYFANSNSAEFDAVVKKIGAEKFMKIAKIQPDASYSLSKMLYTLSLHGDKVSCFLLIAGFIAFKLSGVRATDISLACRTLVYDVEKREWSKELLELAGIDEKLMPPVYESGKIIGTLLPDVAERLGLEPTVKVVLGSHDQIVNALACGITVPGEAMDGTGTTECIEPLFAAIPEDTRFAEENYACVPYLDNKGYVTYAYNTSGGAVVKWYRDKLAQHLREQAKAEGISIYDVLNRVCPDQPTNLMVMPYLMGMGGTPDLRADVRGMIYGLGMDTGLPEIYRAILEGLSFEMRYNMEALAKYNMAPKRLYACGGGSKSRIWLHIKADIWNCEIIPVETDETGALGSAILGFAAVLEEKDRCAFAQKFVKHGKPVMPDPEKVKIYDEKYQLYKKLRTFIVNEL